MERYIKALSIVLIASIAIFFLSTYGVVNGLGDGTTSPDGFTQFLLAIFNGLMYIIPLLYIVDFAIGMYRIFKRVVNQSRQTIAEKFEKYPFVWFGLATLSFVVFVLFMNMLTIE